MERNKLTITTPKSNVAVYIGRQSLSFFDRNLPEIKVLNLPPEVMTDMEVINEAQLAEIIATFVEQNQIKPSKVVIILGTEVYFEHTNQATPPNNPNQTQNQLPNQSNQVELSEDQFAESLPFAGVFVKKIKLKKKTILIGVNRNLYQPIINALSKLKFEIKTILPELAVVKNMEGQGFNLQTAKSIAKSADQYKEYDLFNRDSANHTTFSEENNSTTNSKRPSRIMILGGILIISLIVLIIMIIAQFSNTQAQPPKPSSSPSQAVQDTSQSSQAMTQTGSKKINQLTVQINDSSSSQQLSQELKKDLQSLGINQITINNTNSSTTSKNLIVINAALPDQIKTSVTSLLQQKSLNFSIKESNDLAADIIITLAQP